MNALQYQKDSTAMMSYNINNFQIIQKNKAILLLLILFLLKNVCLKK